jgi:four helix bundle protein
VSVELEELRVLQAAEQVADGLWRQVVRWESFARKVVGEQMARAADSIGANIAEAYGRYHYGEKLQFLYYARGSLYETKYWLNRASQRSLMQSEQVQDYTDQLTNLARQLNAFASAMKAQRQTSRSKPKIVGESVAVYRADEAGRISIEFIGKEDDQWLRSISSP